jgi:hypothetical protein
MYIFITQLPRNQKLLAHNSSDMAAIEEVSQFVTFLILWQHVLLARNEVENSNHKINQNFEIMMGFHANCAEKFAVRHWLPRQIVATDEEC